jgi:ABC-type nickel/cobalt efflux system permease component RcnA
MTSIAKNIGLLARRALPLVNLLLLLLVSVIPARTHPLGNFTINHFARIATSTAEVRIHYVIDMAEIPTFQVSQGMAKNPDGSARGDELDAFLRAETEKYRSGLRLISDGERVPLQLNSKKIALLPGAGGLPILRIECDFAGLLPRRPDGSRRLHYEETNFSDRIGWREIVLEPIGAGTQVFNSNAFGSALTDELKTYPQDMLTAPLNETAADWSVTTGGLPPNSSPLLTREGHQAGFQRDRFAELIAVPAVTPWIALLGLLIAAGLGALHAFSPGHGKTVVAAYLVGSRGTARHAVFLGLTVTVTHTIGVFALGIVTLFATAYVVPERLFPIISFVSGAIVFTMGLTLFARRLRGLLPGAGSHDLHSHDGHSHAHDAAHSDDHAEHEHHSDTTHSHGGRLHSHLPPKADGQSVTWRSLLALGVGGGLLPCPSALVVLLSAISLHRVAFGLALVVGFSIGLAATLTAVGLVFVYMGRFIKSPARENRLIRILPVVSALVIACIGAAIAYEALVQSGVNIASIPASFAGALRELESRPLSSNGGLAVLALGLIFGLKHATEVDHVVAVSTIVSEHRNLKRAAFIGGLWGMGHTASLIVVGVFVLLLRIAIPEGVSNWLEFGVALMIIGLGINVFARSIFKRSDIHIHKHEHGGASHIHLHFHEQGSQNDGQNTDHDDGKHPHSHKVSRIGLKPLFVGAMHGLAGSGALTLLVLTQISSVGLGLLYLAVFGFGSVLGMMLMSFLVGLPFALSGGPLKGLSHSLQILAGLFSVAFGLWYAYQTAIASGLLGSI